MSMKFLVTAELGRESRVVSFSFALIGLGGFLAEGYDLSDDT